jgi:hypothetical protein
MELTNLVFAGLLIVMIVGGMAIMFADVQTNYPNAATTNPRINETYTSLNASVSRMNTMANQAANSTVNTNTQDTGISGALGYLFGAISSLQILFIIPDIILNFVGTLAGMGSAFIPPYVLPLITVAVSMIAVIGFLFYLMKVK